MKRHINRFVIGGVPAIGHGPQPQQLYFPYMGANCQASGMCHLATLRSDEKKKNILPSPLFPSGDHSSTTRHYRKVRVTKVLKEAGETKRKQSSSRFKFRSGHKSDSVAADKDLIPAPVSGEVEF